VVTNAPERQTETGVTVPDDQESLELFWSVYDAAYDEINDELMAGLRHHPEFGALLQALSAEQMQEQQSRSRELMRRAIVDGEWDAYLDDLRTEGVGYARAGISFSSWFGLLADFRAPLWRRVFEAHSGDDDQLMRVTLSADRVTDIAMATIGEAYLHEKQRVIREQGEAIHELSSPVLLLADSLLLLPLIGLVDSARAQQFTENLLEAIRDHRARVVVIDVTGIPEVDSMVANHLIQTANAADLMGATAIVTGMSTVNAQTLVRIGVSPNSLNTFGDLSTGLAEAGRILGTHPANGSRANGKAGT
jgi:rsbT co-antagonist protein RsbR